MGLKPIKQFGQHFLIDESLAEEIVKAADINTSDPVWEIGPGKGVLTKRILNLTDNLTAFEIDTRLIALLTNQFGMGLKLINRDILACDWHDLLEQNFLESGKKAVLVSNLPYQITSPILYRVEENACWIDRAVFMMQREVAQRLTASPGKKAYGVLTLKLCHSFVIEHLFDVPPIAFDPPPQVFSSVIRLIPRQDKPKLKSLDMYFKIIHTAFNHRRKNLKNNLKELFSNDMLRELELTSGIDFNRRGETIDETEFVHLADCVCRLTDAQSGSEQRFQP